MRRTSGRSTVARHVSLWRPNLSKHLFEPKQTYLRGGHVSRGPREKGDGQGCRLLGLPCDVPGDEGEDEISLGEVELSAVESNEQTHAVRMVRRDAVDDGRSKNGRTAEFVSRAAGLHVILRALTLSKHA